MSNRSRSIVSWVAFGLAFVVALAAAPVLYVSTVIEEEDAFVSLTDAVIDHPDVRSALATEATNLTFDVLEADELVADLLPEQTRSIAVPLTRIAANQVTDAAFVVLDTPVGVDARRAAVRELHRQFLADDDSLVIDLRAVLVRTARELGGPAVGAGAAKLVADTETGRFVIVDEGSSEQDLLAAVRAIPVLGVALFLVAFVLWALGVLVAPDRRAALIRAAVLNAIASVVAIVIVAIALYGVLGMIGEGSPSAFAVAEVVTQDFIRLQWGTILSSLAVALAAMLLGDRVAAVALRRLPGELWRRSPDRWHTIADIIGDNAALARIVVWAMGALTLVGWRNPTVRVVLTVVVLTGAAHGVIWLLTAASPLAARARARLGAPGTYVDPTSSRARRLRLNAAGTVAVIAVFWPAWSRDVFITLFVALAVVFVLIDVRTAWTTARAADRLAVADVADEGWSRRRSLMVAFGVSLALVVVGALFTGSADDRVAASTGCNGADELCDRAIDEIVFAGSHNAMSSTDLGWQLAMQTGDIVTQLDHGVRALLIDALYWRAEGVVEGGDDAAAAAVIEASLSNDEPRAGTWLCHGFCALGATDLTAGLADISLWLDANPREILLIIVQDEISTPDLEAAFEASGLRDHVHIHEPGTAWPTLGALIDADERVLVWGENGGSPDSWFQNVWDTDFTETPFAFGLRSDFSCAPNRGDDANDLFLINHWLTNGIPVREIASSVNSREALLERVADCEAERGRRPTILAVDFVETGDLVATVAELNEVDG
ncbi:MAG: hypothetical protein AAGA90_04255 [Actinomycetota bacterium]